MIQKFKKERKKCPYVVYLYGVPICGLNMCPCEKVSDGLCERIYVTLENSGRSSNAGKAK